MVVGPPLASATNPAVACFRPCAPQSARPSSALAFDASNGSGICQKRPSTARGSTVTASSRKLLQPTTEWNFLGKAIESDNMCTRRKSSVSYHRPATTRGHKSANNTPSAVDFLPKRPVTARPNRHPSDKGIDTVRVCIAPVDLTDTRAICEGAHHESDQVEYGDPLHGRSVEPRNVEMVTRSCFSVVNAVSIQDSFRSRAFQARAQGDYAKAIKYYTKAIEVVPDDHLSMFQLALAYEKTGSSQQALATYKKVISLEEGNCFAYFNVGNILMRQNKAEDAIRYYTSAIDKCELQDKNRLLFFRQRGAAYRKNGDYEKASRDYAHYHAKCGNLVNQHNRPWDTGISSTDAGSRVDVDIEYQANTNDSRAVNRPGASQVVYNSESLYAVPESCTLEEIEIPFETWSRHRVFEIASATASSSRSEDELLFFMDVLQKVFPFCAPLRPEACTLLCSKVVGMTNLRAGTPLFLEQSKGSHVFFVYRGSVSTYKTVVQQIAQVPPTKEKSDGEEDSDNGPSRSWESLFAAMGLHESDGDAFSSAVQQITGISPQWSTRQMKLCQFGHGKVFGFQGRHSGDSRMYSAVVAEDCDVLALSWEDLLAVDREQRVAEQKLLSQFLRTVPVFHGIPISELYALALHAKKAKTVGSKVICSEGQFVDGIFIVHEGEVCQLSPSELRLPPDLSIAFNLCGSFAVPAHEQEKTRLEFFTQLEFTEDPLAFAHLSNIVHGFLPHDFIEKKLQHLHKIKNSTNQIQDEPLMIVSEPPSTSGTKKSVASANARQVTALALRRGAFFFASSSWIPPRKSRQASSESLGVAYAKSALVSRSSAELLFFSSADLIAALSLASRDILQRNSQAYTRSPDVKQNQRHDFSVPPNTRLTTFPKPPPTQGEDMLEQLEWTKSWNKYKHKLVQAIIQDKKTNKPRNCFQTSRCDE